MKVSKWMVVIFAAFILGGCNQGANPTVSPVNNTVSPVAEPVKMDQVSCLTRITPVGNTVCGYVWDRDRNAPVPNRPVYLADALFSSDGSGGVFAALDVTTAPIAVTDENGMFYFVNVPSQMFFLMVESFPQSLMLHEREIQDNDLFVDFREKTGNVDLGTVIAYDLAYGSP